jgi:ferrous-iron efflux pump FieF
VSAVGILWRAIDRLIHRAETEAMGTGIAVSVLAIVLTFVLLWYQRQVIARTGSVAIKTDNVHYKSDLMLNGSVIVALVLDQALHVSGADAVFGIAIALWLAWGAWRASSEAVHQLMDREWPETERQQFLAAAAAYPELQGLHDLRTRKSGTLRFVQFHVWVPADWTVREAHDRLDHVEEQLQQRFPDTEILIHVDPEGQTDRETLLPSDITESAQ